MRAPTFDRGDFTVTKLLVGAVGVGVPVFTLLLPLWGWLTAGPLAYEFSDVGRPALQPGLRLDDGVSLQGGSTVGVRIEGASTSTWLVSLLPGVLLSVMGVTIAVVLLRLVQRIQAGTPFVAASARSLRLVGFVLLGGTIALGVGTGIADRVVRSRTFTESDVATSFTFSFLPVLAGLLVLALAEAFAQGVRIQDDLEGLV